MSLENVEVVQAAFETLEREGSEALLRHIDPKVVWEVRSDLPDAGSYRGHEGMRKLFRNFEEALDSTWYPPQEFIGAGDQVVVVLRWGGRGAGTGVEVEERDETWIFTVLDRKIVHVKEYATKRDALEAAGLSE